MSSEQINKSFFRGINRLLLEDLYEKYLQDHNAVDSSWLKFFKHLKDTSVNPDNCDQNALVTTKLENYTEQQEKTTVASKQKSQTSNVTASSTTDINDIKLSLQAQMLIRLYQVRGHLHANLDPLGLYNKKSHQELQPKNYNFSANDYNKSIYLGGMLGFEYATLTEILEKLQNTYCSSIGIEFMHMQDIEQKDWLQRQLEIEQHPLSKEEKIAVFQLINKAHSFEKFLATKFPGVKRFGLEGGESLIPLIENIIQISVSQDVSDFMLGMAHRGRLNVLANILAKPGQDIFSQFHQNIQSNNASTIDEAGDVKYHLGHSSVRIIHDKKINLNLADNPSHLEAVNPVVIGKTRAIQDYLYTEQINKVLSILIHGDAAFAGQGLVSETLTLSELKGYNVGGSIHIIINNQIGFTTSPKHARSSVYCSDVAKAIQAPILHVNGDDIEAVVRIAKIAALFRNKFKKDIVIDMYCYRKHGHNEIDEPMFTQPIMYKKIKKHTPVIEQYMQKLIASKTIDKNLLNEFIKNYHDKLTDEFEKGKNSINTVSRQIDFNWSNIDNTVDINIPVITGITKECIQKIAVKIGEKPQNITLHEKIARQLQVRSKALLNKEAIDWGTAEVLAFGSLLLEQYAIRLSGQDSGRGTFSHRHGILYSQENKQSYIPLNHLNSDQQAKIDIIDSPLSEAAVLGFDFGYSLISADTLVLWEAQFGDFANGAQVIIDQFLVTCETKWQKMSGMILLLPHGYEGQGSEHSSARIERFLQHCSENNIIVANCTTPSNYFHILRRQIYAKYRKPLILMTPKSLLRHKEAVSYINDFTDDTYFKSIISDESVLRNVKRLVLCSGKVYYDLLAYRQSNRINNVAIVRIEQLYPLNKKLLIKELQKYRNAEIVWCQEEPQNMGAWNYLDRILEKLMQVAVMQQRRPIYIGRSISATTATGFAHIHKKEQEKLVYDAFNV